MRRLSRERVLHQIAGRHVGIWGVALALLVYSGRHSRVAGQLQAMRCETSVLVSIFEVGTAPIQSSLPLLYRPHSSRVRRRDGKKKKREKKITS